MSDIIPEYGPDPRIDPRAEPRPESLPRRSLWRYVTDRNPFYLLSAICMLFACVALTNSSSWTSIKLNRLLILIGTLNFYEALLVGLALYLTVKRGLRRDGNIL